MGDNVKTDIARMTRRTRTFGDDIAILTDANIGYAVADVRQVMPAMDELNIGWLEEPFPRTTTAATGWRSGFGRTPLAAGENHYTRFEFDRVIEDGNITILQPDLCKTAASPRCLRIAAMASTWNADPSALLHDGPQPRRHDPLLAGHRQRRLFRG